jgi:uncharacterized protein YjbJ (UPF0337 family)
MEKEFFQGKWNQLKGAVKQTWGDLTDDDLTKMQGDIDKAVGFLQEKYGMAKTEAKEKMNKIIKDLNEKK